MVLMAITLPIQVQMGWNFECNLSFTQILYRWCSYIKAWPTDRDRSNFYSFQLQHEIIAVVGLGMNWECIGKELEKGKRWTIKTLGWVLTRPAQPHNYMRCLFSTSAPLCALVLLVAAYVVCMCVAVVVPLLMSNSGATSKCNYDGFR